MPSLQWPDISHYINQQAGPHVWSFLVTIQMWNSPQQHSSLDPELGRYIQELAGRQSNNQTWRELLSKPVGGIPPIFGKTHFVEGKTDKMPTFFFFYNFKVSKLI